MTFTTIYLLDDAHTVSAPRPIFTSVGIILVKGDMSSTMVDTVSGTEVGRCQSRRWFAFVMGVVACC